MCLYQNDFHVKSVTINDSVMTTKLSIQKVSCKNKARECHMEFPPQIIERVTKLKRRNFAAGNNRAASWRKGSSQRGKPPQVFPSERRFGYFPDEWKVTRGGVNKSNPEKLKGASIRPYAVYL